MKVYKVKVYEVDRGRNRTTRDRYGLVSGFPQAWVVLSLSSVVSVSSDVAILVARGAETFLTSRDETWDLLLSTYAVERRKYSHLKLLSVISLKNKPHGHDLDSITHATGTFHGTIATYRLIVN